MPPKNASFPSAPQAALLLLGALLLQYLVNAALYDARGILDLDNAEIGALGMLLSSGVLVTVVMQRLGIGHRDLLHPVSTPPAATFLFVVPPVMLLLPLVLLVDGAMQSVLEAVFPLSEWELRAFGEMTAPTLPAFVACCVLAPVLEEMLFRGILLRAFLQRYPRGLAIAYSALYFGAMHLNVYQFVLAFYLGLLLGWLYERSRSLIPCIALHAAVNIAATVMTRQAEAAPLQADEPASLLSWLGAIVAAALGALILRRLLGRRRPDAMDAA